MKACESYIDLVMRSIDRETTPREEQMLQDHLAQCDACRALYETYRALDAGLAAVEEEPPETLTRAVMNSIRAEQRERTPKHLLKRFRFTAIAAVAAVLVLVFARFQPNVTSVTSDSMNTAKSTEADVPQMEAELRAADEAPAAQEPALARSEEQTDEVVEEAAAEAPAEPEIAMAPALGDADPVAAANDSDAMDLSKQAKALRSMGLQGNVYLISGVSSDALAALFPEARAIELDTGEIVYEASADAVELAITAGELTVSECDEDDSASGNSYFVLLD